MSVTELLSLGGYITFNRRVAEEVGTDAALIFGALCFKANQFEGQFYVDQDELADMTMLSVFQVRKAVETLKKCGLVSVKRKGVPARNYYEIDEDIAIKMFINSTSRYVKIKHLEVQKLDNILINNTNKKTNKNNIRKFAPPSVEEVRAYCQERKNHVDAQKFVDYYTSKGWLVGKTMMKDWKASVRTWERNTFDKPKRENVLPEYYGKETDNKTASQDELKAVQEMLKKMA